MPTRLRFSEGFSFTVEFRKAKSLLDENGTLAHPEGVSIPSGYRKPLIIDRRTAEHSSMRRMLSPRINC